MATAKRRQKAKPANARTPAEKREAPRLFVSFWNLCLENLPKGVFHHREVTAKEAKRLLDAARAAGAVSGVSEDDLLAPYHKREKSNYAKLCRTLHEHHDIALSLEDFVLEDCDDDGKVGYMISPLLFAEVRGANRLLVVNCHFVMRKRPKKKGLDFDIAPDSVTFHLFEAVDSSTKWRALRRQAT
jgi:hypothetical protein